jgi:hypothetical protein
MLDRGVYATMSPFGVGNLLRCDCGHSAAQHTDAGCGAGCRCLKSPSSILAEEIETLRPEWAEPEDRASA